MSHEGKMNTQFMNFHFLCKMKFNAADRRLVFNMSIVCIVLGCSATTVCNIATIIATVLAFGIVIFKMS